MEGSKIITTGIGHLPFNKRKTLSGARFWIFGTETFVWKTSVIFIRYSRNNSQITFSDLYPSRTQGMQWGTQKAFLSVELIMNNIMEHTWFWYWSSESLNVFKSKVLKFIWPKASSFFNYLNAKEVKLITRLRLGLSHVRDHKFKCF